MNVKSFYGYVLVFLVSLVVLTGCGNSSSNGGDGDNSSPVVNDDNTSTVTDANESTPIPDTTKPVITLNGASIINLTKGTAYTELGATATDDRDGTVAVTISGSVDVNTVNSYTITYKAKDSAGNEAIVTRTVKVVIQQKSEVITSSVSGNTASYNAIATFDVLLKNKPSSNVTLPLSSSDKNEGIVNVENLVFTPKNWNQRQMVVVKGQNTNVVDGKQSYKIVLGVIESSDVSFSGVNPDDVEMKGISLKLNDITDSTKFIAGLESTIGMNVEYTGNSELNYSLVEKPNGMSIDSKSGFIHWKPALVDEGKSLAVKVKVNNGNLSDTINFTSPFQP